MADFVTLSCPSCGHKLQITEDIDRFVCAACGNEHIVTRSDGVIVLRAAEDIKGVKIGVDKTASELAIVRLSKEITDLEGQIKSLRIDSNYDFYQRDPGLFLRILGFVFILVTVLGIIYTIVLWGINDSKKIIMSISTVLALSITVILFVSSSSMENKSWEVKETKLQAETQSLQAKIRVKQEELKKHKEIVAKL